MNISRLHNGLTLRASEQRQVLEALAFLAISRVVLALLPFRIAIRGLGLRLADCQIVDIQGPPAPPVVPIVANAVRRAATVAPFRAVCLQQAVAAALMLRWRGFTAQIHFGVAKDESGKLIAHAWSRCRGEMVTGGAQAPEYQPISVFST